MYFSKKLIYFIKKIIYFIKKIIYFIKNKLFYRLTCLLIGSYTARLILKESCQLALWHGNIPQWFDFYVFPFDVEILLFDKFETMIFPTVDDRETPFFSSFLAEFFSFFAFSSFSFVSVFVSSFGLALFDENWLQGNSKFSFFRWLRLWIQLIGTFTCWSFTVK